MSRKHLIMALSLLTIGAGTAALRAQEEKFVDPGGDGGAAACPNTICLGVSLCQYSAGYNCSLTSNSCTNRLC